MANIDQPPEDWHIGSLRVEKRVNISTLLAIAAILVMGLKVYWRVEALEKGQLDIQAEQQEGKERADARQVETQRSIEGAMQIGRSARDGLETRLRSVENSYSGLSATLQGMSAQLTGIGADVRDLRKTIESDAP